MRSLDEDGGAGGREHAAGLDDEPASLHGGVLLPT
jgi:hypothetical protein